MRRLTNLIPINEKIKLGKVFKKFQGSITNKRLSQLTGIHEGLISLYRNDRSIPSFETLRKLTLLGWDVNQLLIGGFKNKSDKKKAIRGIELYTKPIEIGILYKKIDKSLFISNKQRASNSISSWDRDSKQALYNASTLETSIGRIKTENGLIVDEIGENTYLVIAKPLYYHVANFYGNKERAKAFIGGEPVSKQGFGQVSSTGLKQIEYQRGDILLKHMSKPEKHIGVKVVTENYIQENFIYLSDLGGLV